MSTPLKITRTKKSFSSLFIFPFVSPSLPSSPTVLKDLSLPCLMECPRLDLSLEEEEEDEEDAPPEEVEEEPEAAEEEEVPKKEEPEDEEELIDA